MGRRSHSTTGITHFNRLVIKNGRRYFPSSTVPSLPSSPVKKRNCSHLERDNETGNEDLPYIEYTPPLDKPPHRNSSNDYMRVWKQTKHNLYLHELLERKASIHTSHCRDPFHWIERWTGIFYEQSWLWKVGLVINLGHQGERCPQSARNLDADIDIKEDRWFDLEDLPSTSADPKPPDRVYNGGWVMTIIHTSGVHHLPVVFCGCSGAAAKDIQLFHVGLYPSTYKSCQTVFTFQLLNDYLLENLKCKTSATHYYSKLRRITNFAFPNSIPNRYHKLIRVGRQYHNLTELATCGFGHKGKAPRPGEMVFFCRTCPLPGVNLPDDWNENPQDPENWKYTQGFVADGNFTAAHQKQA
ncbi:uncharacterized protein LACBIDRAFT_302274 [Laccaria bicolor S238N-H82]|uniref:Predicted protein n=1 Tax=Laccaria bicolor (strain S238N-H82 / ATCC MYA-4686) TaxID=486041 RepID=B0DHF6_LACBS|nr:uncharacterized protein LACBIDRAFT_302274 [Laccaria bicolor S238N-H82]EDR06098.1 predicted protein [Laccaria bicolor S238N-H82]|eukprot:XP_001883386.1 predicted protein [Laccaria bicolor S238N-H82]